MRRLLLLSCSRQKRLDEGQLPAIERYDGPAFKVLRRYLQVDHHKALDVYVLSAQFGLISGDALIPAYDCYMTTQRMHELREATATAWHDLHLSQRYQFSFLYAGAMYRNMLEATNVTTLPTGQVTMSIGSPGVQLAQLKSWLYQFIAIPSTFEPVTCNAAAPKSFKLRGSEYITTINKASAIVRRAVQNDLPQATHLGAWYALVDGYKVAPKWLVSQLTGLPVSGFHSEEARRVLRCLGFSVYSTFVN